VSDARDERHQTRVLILAPGGKDAALARTVLANANVECEVVSDIVALVRGIAEGVGAVLVTEEAIAEGSGNLLALEIVRQPPWSDLPILVMTHQGADSPVAVQALQSLGNVTLLERPIRVSALVSAVRSALRARHRQHQTRQYLQERERTAAQLRDADRRKDEFLATLAHELRNPLSPISNALEILRLSGNADPGAQPVLEMMERQVNHLVRLVDDLLDVSRVTLGKMVLRRAPIAIGDVLESAIESSRPLIASRRHRLTTTIPDEPLVVDGDAVRLAQVFANLLNNAAKYTNEQGEIAVTVRREGKDVVVAVRDNGLGIPGEMLGRVFEIFAQVDGLQGRAGGGLGIGLTLVRSLVAMHGGSVAVVSEGRGKGSEFVVRLPLSVASEPRSIAPRYAPAGGAATHRVLVVDDNVDAAESLGMVLDLLGAEVRVVNSGPDALAMMASYGPTVVVLDIGMPAMDGYEVARRIRSDRRYDDVTLIAMTGWGQDEDRRRTRAEGFDHHLIKPPDIVALQTVLASIGSGKRRARVAAMSSSGA
jgi:signal transduction histidine kinase/CheY-like chemotaxis protein